MVEMRVLGRPEPTAISRHGQVQARAQVALGATFGLADNAGAVEQLGM